MSAKLLLGVDGGGSKTLVALADAAGNVVRTGSGAGVNPMDNPHWRREFDAAMAAARIAEGELAGAVAALPCYGEVEEISQTEREVVRDLVGAIPQRVINDVDAAHYGAFAGGPGLLILSGTGSMAWARDAAGKSYRVGGWGEGFGDEGSAYWIGIRAIALASQHLDGRAAAPGLVEALFDDLGLASETPQDSLAGWFAGLGHRRSRVAALAPLVDRLARQGDAAARRITGEAADALALHVVAIARQTGAGDRPDWSYAGGTFKGRALLDALAERIGGPPLPPRLPPIGGALLYAARDLGWPIDNAWIERLAASIAGKAAPDEAITKINQGE
jgi:N-acetylglucosamine kinase-like BadF-type ATPase